MSRFLKRPVSAVGLKTSSTHTVQAFNAFITAVYYPTSYGSVVTVTESSSDAPAGSKPIQVMVDEDPAVTKTAYQVDLRTLELKAKQAHIKALEAELALRKAKDKLTRERAGQVIE